MTHEVAAAEGEAKAIATMGLIPGFVKSLWERVGHQPTISHHQLDHDHFLSLFYHRHPHFLLGPFLLALAFALATPPTELVLAPAFVPALGLGLGAAVAVAVVRPPPP